MILKRSPRLEVSALEDRLAPATLSFSGGSLTVSNPRGALDVAQQATGAFKVTDAGINHGTYFVGNNITINGFNGNDTVTVSLAAGKVLPGTLTVNTFNGHDTVSVNGAGTGRVGGRLNVGGSNGNDLLQVGNASGLTVSGGGTLAMGAGNDSVTVGDGVTFGNTVAATQANNFTLGAAGAPARINGSLSVDNSVDGALGNALTMTAPGAVAGSFFYTGGTGADALDVAGTLHSIAGQRTELVMGEGTNSLNLSGSVGFGTPDSDLIYEGGNNFFSSDSVTFAGTAVVTDDVELNMVEGANFYDLASNFFVGGDFSILAGGDVDDVGVIDAIINGDVSVVLGGGDDSVTFGTLGSGVGSIGGNLAVDVGDGNDGVAVNAFVGGGGGQVTVNLGAGADTFDACDPVNSAYGAATIDLGVDFDFDVSTVLVALAPFTTYLNVGGGDVTTTC
jgi:fibronectin-binding autotransporter adhesin